MGWIFTQSSKERDYIMHTQEICQMAQWQHELGEHCVTGVVTLESGDEGSQVHFEAFQVRKHTCWHTSNRCAYGGHCAKGRSPWEFLKEGHFQAFRSGCGVARAAVPSV